MTSQWQRSTTPLRASGPMRMAPCVGCGAMTKTRDSWALCPNCTDVARSYVRTIVRTLPWQEQRPLLNRFWSNEHAIRAAVAEARVGVTV